MITAEYCSQSPNHEHEFNPNDYSRDDLGFYLKCTYCTEIKFFDVDNEEELFNHFDGWDED